MSVAGFGLLVGAARPAITGRSATAAVCAVWRVRHVLLAALEELVEFRGVFGVVLGVVGGDLLQAVARPVVQVLDGLAGVLAQGLAQLCGGVLQCLDDRVGHMKLAPAAFVSNSAACPATVRACACSFSA
ncbi:hypothetical protein, partial [Streptomyces sioyaensis]|uniref:hypothetical protein n=1 Tax=Streptomyces sioyaensis TaxID=67364 RepID=UPI001F3D3B86